MVVAQQDFRDEEYEVPKDIFEKAGFEVITVAEKKGIARGKLGVEAKVDLSFNEINIRDYEAIVFVGGPGAAHFFNDNEVLNLARDFAKEDKIMAAICIAPIILANAGLLSGKKATVTRGEEEALTVKGVIYTGNSVEVDDSIITAEGPEAAAEFAEKIIQILG